MKNKLFTLLFCATAGVSFAAAEIGSAAENAVALAANGKASVESVCLAVSDAVQNNQGSPAELMKRVIATRKSWTATQLAALYKSVLMASPALSASFLDDVEIFEKAGKPTQVNADAAEGVKLLSVLYGANVPGVNADTVLASVVADSVGASVVMPVAPLRDVAAGEARRPRPAKPTPPSVSADN